MSDAAVANIVTGVVTVATLVIGFLTLWVKLRYNTQQAEKAAIESAIAVVKATEVEKKIDNNTALTVAGTNAAASSAILAANNAAEAKSTAEDINSKLNGRIEDIIEKAVAPIRKTLEDHIAHDHECMTEIRRSLADLQNRLR